MSCRTQATNRQAIEQYLNCEIGGYATGNLLTQDYSSGFSLELDLETAGYARNQNNTFVNFKVGANYIRIYKTAVTTYIHSGIGGAYTYDALNNEDKEKMLDRRQKLMIIYNGATLAGYLNGIQIGTNKAATGNFGTGIAELILNGGTGATNSQLQKHWGVKVWNEEVDPTQAMNGELDGSITEEFKSDKITATSWISEQGSSLTYTGDCYPKTDKRQSIEQFVNCEVGGSLTGMLPSADFSNGFYIERECELNNYQNGKTGGLFSINDGSNRYAVYKGVSDYWSLYSNNNGSPSVLNTLAKHYHKTVGKIVKIGYLHTATEIHFCINGVIVQSKNSSPAAAIGDFTLTINAAYAVTSLGGKEYNTKIWNSEVDPLAASRGELDSSVYEHISSADATPDGVVGKNGTVMTYTNTCYPWLNERTPIKQYLQCGLEGYATSDVSDIDFSNGLTIQTKCDLRYAPSGNRRMIQELWLDASNNIHLMQEVAGFQILMKIGGVSLLFTLDQELFAKCYGKVATFAFSFDNTTVKIAINGVPVGEFTKVGVFPNGGVIHNNIFINNISQYADIMRLYRCDVWNSAVDLFEAYKGDHDSTVADTFDYSLVTPTGMTGSNGHTVTLHGDCYPWSSERKQIRQFINCEVGGYANGTINKSFDFSSGVYVEIDVDINEFVRNQNHGIFALNRDGTQKIRIYKNSSSSYYFMITLASGARSVLVDSKSLEKCLKGENKIGIWYNNTQVKAILNGNEIGVSTTYASEAITETDWNLNINNIHSIYIQPQKVYTFRIWEGNVDPFIAYQGGLDDSIAWELKAEEATASSWIGSDGSVISYFNGCYPWTNSRTPIKQHLRCNDGGYPLADLTDIDFSNGFTIEADAIVNAKTVAGYMQIVNLYLDNDNKAQIYQFSNGTFYAYVKLSGVSSVFSLDASMMSKSAGRLCTFGLSYDYANTYVTLNGVPVGTRALIATPLTTGLYLVNNKNVGAGVDTDFMDIYANRVWNSAIDLWESYNGDHDSTAVEIFDYANATESGLTGSNGHTVTFNGDCYLKC